MKKLIFIMLSLLLLACGKEEVAEKTRDTLVIADSANPKSLDPHMGNDGSSLRINKQIYSRLVESTGDMKIIPGLAESWEQINPKTVEFKLRKGVKFHNGEDFTAEDVKYSFERMQTSPRIAFILPPLEEIKVIDDYTVQIITKTPFGPLFAHLSHPALAIVNKKAIEKYGKDYGQHPVGTGPYKFESWDAGDKVTLVRNDEYFLTPPTFKHLVVRNIVEASNRTIGLETKELDIALSIGAVDIENIKNNKNLKLLEKPSISYSYIGFNNDKEVFKNKDLRLAINYAIDKQSIVDVVLDGAGKVATSPLAPGVFGFTDKTKAYEYDPEKAREHLIKAGYKDGLTLTLTIYEGNSNSDVATIVQAQLKEIGIDLIIQSYETGAFFTYTAEGKHEMFLGSWGCVTGDADYGLYAVYHSTAKGAAGNRSFYSNPEVDKLLEEGKVSIDPEKRKEIYEKAQEIIVGDAAEVMLYNRILSVGTQRDIQGLNLHPVTLHDFYPVYIEE